MRVLGFKALADDSGQSSVDFIFGFGVFLLTFIFAISFVAGLFTPFQPGAIDLSSVSYRTCALLVEDPGWYIGADGIPSGTALWETYNLSQLETTGSGLRIGLATNKSTPNMISIDKINAFNALAIDNYTIARDRMGLNGSIVYNFNITIVANMTVPSNPSYVNNVTLLNVTSPTSPNNNVELLDRKIMVDMGKQLFLNCTSTMGGGGSAIQWVNVSNLSPDYTQNLYIRVYGAMGNVTSVGWSINNLTAPPVSYWSYGTDYLIYLNGKPAYIGPSGIYLTSNDVLEIVIYNSAMRDVSGNINPQIKYIYIKSNPESMFPGGNVDYFNDPKYRLIDVYYPATLHMELWSYAFS